jgi:hypothetical protein
MANVSPINVHAGDLMQAGSVVAEHLHVAATPPTGAIPTPAAASPVDVAATGAAGAIQTKMAAMQSHLAGKGAQTEATTTAGATALQTQDSTNMNQLQNLVPNMPSGGSGGSGGGIQGGNYHPGQGRIVAMDNGTGGDNTLKVPQRPNPPTVINAHVGENDGRHQCDGWDVSKDVGEAIGGPLLVTGSVLGGIAASPLGPGEWAMAIGGVLTGGATTIDGFKNLEGCE